MLIWNGILGNASMKVAFEALLAKIYLDGPPVVGLCLYQNNITPSQASVIADFTQADFSGYAAIPLETAERPLARIDSEGNVYAVDTIVRTFLQTAVTVTNTVYGWYIQDSTRVYAAGRFDTPLAFDAVGRVLELELGYRLVAGGTEAGIDPTFGTDI